MTGRTALADLSEKAEWKDPPLVRGWGRGYGHRLVGAPQGDASSNQVVDQQPAPGTLVKAGDIVTILYSPYGRAALVAHRPSAQCALTRERHASNLAEHRLVNSVKLPGGGG